ncbi:alcohol acetyltransferase-domain-containing protein [Mortierella sp. GBAus27b]|nr:hypothetical protein BGX31_009097 [Mortierella sp. GBA43]KAI8357469.1 alcohol acetyltransferase-domain-containing protein [Mortierella sp. GBAus27b]
MSLQVVRPVGNLERYNVTRSNLNIYHNVVVGNRIHAPGLVQQQSPHSHSSPEEWAQLLLDPITWLIGEHPSLALVVGGHLTAKPVFLKLESIDLLGLIRLVPIKTALQVDRVLEKEHNSPFDLSDQSTPLWRLVIAPIEGDPSSFYLFYTFHHVIGDGRSAMALTSQLIERLNLQHQEKPHQAASDRTTQIIVTTNKPVPASIESRVNCYPSLRTLVFEATRSLLLPKFVKRALETRYWAGEMDSSLHVPNETQLAFLQFSREETTKIVQAAKRQSTTVQSILYVASIFAAKFVFMADPLPSSSSSLADGRDHGTGYSQGDAIVFATPVSLRDWIPQPIAPEDQGNYTSEILHRNIRVSHDSSFWPTAHAYRKQVVRATTTSSGVRDLLEHFGMLSLLPKHDGAWEQFMANQVTRDQHGRKATLKLSNLGRGWDQSRRRQQQQQEQDEESAAVMGFVVKDGVFSQSSGVTASALTLNVATANGVMTVTTTWQKAAFHGKERGEMFVSEFKRILLEAIDHGREEYLFRDATIHPTRI